MNVVIVLASTVAAVASVIGVGLAWQQLRAADAPVLRRKVSRSGRMRPLLIGGLLPTGILIVVSLVGCGSSSIKRTSTLDFEQAERDQWNAYTPAEQEQYRQAFKLCNDWSTGPSGFKQSEGPTEAADFFIAHDLFNTPLGAGCGDGIANTPLSGSR